MTVASGVQKIKYFFSVDSMVPPDLKKGALPLTRTAYTDFFSLALPSVAEMILVSLISSIDIMMVGSLGHEAIAAVGLTGQPRMLLLSLFFAVNIGVTAVVSRRKGEKRQDLAQLTLRNSLVMIFFLALIIMLPSLVWSRNLMLLAGAQSDTINDAVLYFRILALVLPVNAMTLAITAAQRGVGNTKISFFVNVAANVVNIIFNYLLIGGNFGFPRLGVAGAAIATAIGFVCAFVFSIISLLPKSNFLHLRLRGSWKCDFNILRSVLTVGGNAALEQVALRIGFLSYAAIVAGMGTAAFAAHQICMQFLNLTFSFADGLGVAGTSLVGQNLGKKRSDWAVMFGKVAQRIAILVSVFFVIFLVAFRYPLVGLFTKAPEVLTLSANVMLIVALFMPLQTSSVVISGCLRGSGDTRYVARVMLLCVAIIRPLLALLFVKVFHFNLYGAWSASLIDMALRLALVYRRFNSGKWLSREI